MPTTEIIRETPTVPPLTGTLPAQPIQIPKLPNIPAAVAAEPVLAVQNIQGNVLGGFNKDFQMNLYLKITDPKLFKTWLQAQVGFISTAAEVIAFNRLFKEVRSRSGNDGRIKATWFNIAFTFTGLSKLVTDAGSLTDASFKKGLFTQAVPVLSDHGKGDPKNWLVGGSQTTESDVVLIVAADDEADMLAEVERLENSLEAFVNAAGTTTSGGATVILSDPGGNLPQPLAGHEHFGFLDGISQPGVRGTVSASPTDFLTPRQVSGDPNVGKPGQDLIWPGAFVLGYQGGDPSDFLKPGPVVSGGPAWANDGSYLVLRRLHQDVPSFHAFLKRTAETTMTPPIPSPAHSSAPRFVGSRMVGRWPSGCPVLRSTNDDNFALGNDDCANNNFDYQDATAAVPPPTQPGQCGEDFPGNLSPGDKTGIRCPFSGHLRKTYPRDDIDPQSNQAEQRRILRRGIPYGPVSPSSPDAPVFDKGAVDRGLQFLSYQTSISGQFEFIIQTWVNNANFLKGGTGVDPIIGQTLTGSRSFEMIYPLDSAGNPTHPQQILTTKEDWVWATGGGYFFTPSISAITTHIG